MLVRSSQDKICFTKAFWKKWGRTKSLYEQSHITWCEPEYVKHALEIVLPMVMRYLKGDFRHSDAEAEAEHDLSLWLVNQHRSIKKQPLLKEANWPSFSRAKRRVKAVYQA